MGVVLPSQIVVNGSTLIVGAEGLLGGALSRFWRRTGREVVATSLRILEEGAVHLDIAQPEETWPVLPKCSAAVLCAGITDLERCRRDPAGTRWVNVTQTLKLAHRLAGQGCFVVFLSSNLVFDGSKPLRHPAEPTCPKTEYGHQKAEAEAGLARLGNRFGVVRLTKVFHSEMPLVRGWIQSLSDGKPIHPFADFMCSPISLETTIRAVATVAENQLNGIWHLSSSADITYAGIAQHIAGRQKFDATLVQPVSCREAATLEHRPLYTTLDATRSQKELGFEIPDPVSVIDTTFLNELKPA